MLIPEAFRPTRGIAKLGGGTYQKPDGTVRGKQVALTLDIKYT